jgi:hypothetical protein
MPPELFGNGAAPISDLLPGGVAGSDFRFGRAASESAARYGG